MFRVFFIFLLMIGLVGCGNENESSEGTQAHSHDGESRSMIPEKIEPPETAAEVYLRPFLDEQGTVSEASFGPGETFTLYVIADYKAPFHMSAVEYSFKLPEGIIIDETTLFLEKALTMGERNRDFIMGFGCEPPRKFFLVKYKCLVGEKFTGGEITIGPGVNERNESYLGYVSCQPQIEKVPATGGTVTLKRK